MLVRGCPMLLNLESVGQTEPFFKFGSLLNIAQIACGEMINVMPRHVEALTDI